MTPRRQDGLHRLLTWIGLVALCALAAWSFDGLGARYDAPIQHGADEDWDWQLSLYEASRRAWSAGELPTWNPWTGGEPLLANPESPALYPPFALVLALGTDMGMKALVLAHLWLLVLGAWLAGRELGLSPLAAQCGALFLLGSAFLPHFIGVGHVMFLPLGWLPLAWVAQARGRWRLAGLCLAMPLLAGGHYLALYGALWLGLDALLRGLERERLRPLAAALCLNGLALGVTGLRGPLLLALLAALAWQRPVDMRQHVSRLLGSLLVAGLLCAPKLALLPGLAAWSGRLAQGPTLSIADVYDPALAYAVLTGAAARLSGHEGQNVFWHPAPLLLGLIGLGLLAWRRPRVGVLGLVFWCLGWGGATPVNLLEALHRLPGFDLLRVVERYSLVWTLFLGWGAGAATDLAWARGRRLAALPLVLALGAWLLVALPQARQLQQLGAGPEVPLTDAPFRQVRGPGSNYHAMRLGQGMPERHSALQLPPSAARAVGDPDYRGEAWDEAGQPLPLSLDGDTLVLELAQATRVTVNQRGLPGWTVDGDALEASELIHASLPAGRHVLRYRPAGLVLGGAGAALGLLLLLGGRRRR
ncbi:MAG: hypothetical protein H6741_34450 [Alphaproteobacteria bacterium]|nr:hypothetical protein [Alphaproteobacteria bacterium]